MPLRFIKSPTRVKRGVSWLSDGEGGEGSKLGFMRTCWSRRSCLKLKALLISITGRRRLRNRRIISVLYVGRSAMTEL